MPRFRLQSSAHSVELPIGEFVIGRDGECNLVIDDAAVSRRHATLRVESERVVLEDLGSHNGVLMDGHRLRGRREISPGTRFEIGSQEFVIAALESDTAVPVSLAYDDLGDTLGPGRKEHLEEDVATVRFEHALALGDTAVASQHLRTLLALRMRSYRSGRAIETLATATDAALRMAVVSGDAAWVEWVFEAHEVCVVAMPADTVNELFSIVRKVRTPPVAVMRHYVNTLRQRQAELGPSERFAVQRLDGLLRVALAG